MCYPLALNPAAHFCPSLSLSLSNSRSTFNRSRARREPAINLQRAFPGSTRTAQGSPCRFRAPHFGRSLRRSGAPFPSSPISRIAIQVDATLHSKLSQVVPRRGQAKNSYFMPRPPRREINSAAGRRTCCNYASEFQFTRPLFIASSITKTFKTCHSYQFLKPMTRAHARAYT